jgi:pimeloyl-ACP methyl ester carboxylesterase
MSSMTNDELTVAGIRSPTLLSGDASAAQAVVFLHGNPGSSRDWAGLVKEVGSFSRAIAIDMPGFGKADKPADFDYSVAGYATHLGRLLEVTKVERVHLVLHDFGGPWGLAWAAENRARVASITLINVGIMPGYRWHRMARLWRTPVIGELVMATTTRRGLKAALRATNPRGLPDPYLDEVAENFDAATRRAVLKLYRSTPDSRLADAEATDLGLQAIPALVIWGAKDPYVPVKFAEVQRQFFRVEQIVRLEHSGHWPMIDHPDAVRDAIIPFLRRQTSADPLIP